MTTETKTEKCASIGMSVVLRWSGGKPHWIEKTSKEARECPVSLPKGTGLCIGGGFLFSKEDGSRSMKSQNVQAIVRKNSIYLPSVRRQINIDHLPSGLCATITSTDG
jgi:hypothetical protein